MLRGSVCGHVLRLHASVFTTAPCAFLSLTTLSGVSPLCGAGGLEWFRCLGHVSVCGNGTEEAAAGP